MQKYRGKLSEYDMICLSSSPLLNNKLYKTRAVVDSKVVNAVKPNRVSYLSTLQL